MEDEEKQVNFDAIVVGAGPGGSAIAALLAKAGIRILLVDKNVAAGGRMMTVQRDGFTYELFPINSVPAHNSLFEALTKELGLESEIKVIYPDHIGRFYFEHPSGEIRTADIMRKNISLGALKKLLGLGLKDMVGLIRFFKKLIDLKPQDLDNLRSISALDFVGRYNLPQALSSYALSMFGEGFFELTADRLSAAAFVQAFQLLMRQGGGRYYHGGIGSVFQAFAMTTKKYNGTVLFRTRVEKILVQDGQVMGIKVGNTEYHSPIVISNAGIQPTVLKLVGEEHFDPAYVRWVKNLEVNLACVGYRWILDAPVLQTPMNVYLSYNSTTTLDMLRKMEQGIFPDLNHTYIYLGTTSFYEGLAPPGKQLVYASMTCLPDPSINIQPYLDRLRAIVEKIQPDLFQHIEKEECFGPANVPGVGRDAVLPGQGGESYGIALSVGQYKDERLNGDSPIKGLYFVGSDAGGFGLGTHQAVDSAVNLSRRLLGIFRSNDKTTALKVPSIGVGNDSGRRLSRIKRRPLRRRRGDPVILNGK